ncbi:MAG: hypothetical protein MJH09_08335 [Cetobacterium sp.]|nr:hypothetical protein [Cetobacterium sp.]
MDNKINSWGRSWKKQFSLTFKKDENLMEEFLNEKVDPTSYIKELILKDMKLLKTEINTNSNSNGNNSEDVYNINEKSKEKLNKMFQL